MKKIFILSAAGLLLLMGCAKKNESGKEMQKNYHAALVDSVKAVTAEIDSCNDMAKTLSDKVGQLLPEFRAVDNSREVEGYLIFQGWEKRYPLQSTGLVARLSASHQIELVGVLKGGYFDQIRINVPSATAETSVVAYDQALNYRANGMNTVMFSGDEADAVAKLIADNELNPITVTFLNGGKTTGTWKMPNDYAKMITMSYLLYSSYREQKALELQSMKLGEKLKLLREHQPGDEGMDVQREDR